MSSAIDTTFHWVRNPTILNSLATTYVSKRGSDVSGDGTANNPYAGLAKATAMATAGTNIMIDDGSWSESITLNNRNFNFFGNANTILYNWINYYVQKFYYIKINGLTYAYFSGSYYKNCVIINKVGFGNQSSFWADNCIIIQSAFSASSQIGVRFNNCVLLKCYNVCVSRRTSGSAIGIDTINVLPSNNIIVNSSIASNDEYFFSNTNFTNSAIQSDAANSINNASTGQTLADYFNYVHPNVLANPTTATIDDWMQCDFTAKAGSKNIGAGEKGTTIGLNEGFTMYADNSANDVYNESNGATLRNIAWDSTLNGYTLVQKERVCQGATSTTITLDSSASAVDDYYNNLFIGIVDGDGYGELFLITDYDGATKTATIDGTWTTTPTTNSIYTISGTILSAVKDLGKAIKVKRNWTFTDNFTALTDGQWAEFMTHVETNGKQFPVNCYSYEYSTDGANFFQGQTADDLVSATNGENKVTDAIYGDCSANYNEATAKNLVMRYIRVRVHIGFNIGQLGE